MRSASEQKAYDSTSKDTVRLPNGILQCGKCWSFITTTSRVQNVYSCSNLILIGLSESVPSVCISSEKQLCVPGDQYDSLGELSVFQNVACRSCCVNLGRLYLATTPQLDLLRNIPLLHEHSLQYQDAETCEVGQLSTLVQPVIIKDTKSEKNDNFQYTFQQRSPLTPSHTPTHLQRLYSSGRQHSISNEHKNSGNQQEPSSKVSVFQGAKKMEETIAAFSGSLMEFDERIGTSESQVEFLNSQIVKLLLALKQQQQQQPQQQSQQKQQFKQQMYPQTDDFSAGSRDRQLSTPKISRPRTPEAFSSNQRERFDWQEKQ